jgi:hypothetical protein
MNKDNSLKRDIGFAALGVIGFYAVLVIANYIDQSLGLSAAYNLVDVASIFLKVAVASALSWGLMRIAFKNTLGKDFGSKFDEGWASMRAVEKARWMIGVFITVFLAILLGSSGKV